MENKGNMILTLDSGIFEHNGLLDSLLDNGYTITMNKDGLCLYLKYRFKSDEPQADNGIGCSRCESRYVCFDRDMPNAVNYCNNYGKITDES